MYVWCEELVIVFEVLGFVIDVFCGCVEDGVFDCYVVVCGVVVFGGKELFDGELE